MLHHEFDELLAIQHNFANENNLKSGGNSNSNDVNFNFKPIPPTQNAHANANNDPNFANVLTFSSSPSMSAEKPGSKSPSRFAYYGGRPVSDHRPVFCVLSLPFPANEHKSNEHSVQQNAQPVTWASIDACRTVKSAVASMQMHARAALRRTRRFAEAAAKKENKNLEKESKIAPPLAPNPSSVTQTK